MTPDEILLREVCDHPGDDGPRLAYADWLEHNGAAARAEFIRLQCARARRARGARVPPLTPREKELLRQHEDRWRAELPAWPGIAWRGWSRGFPTWCIADSLAAFAACADRLFAAVPIQRLGFERMEPGEAVELAALPALARLRSLSLYCRCSDELDDESAAALAASPSLANLRKLDLSANKVGDAGAEALAASPHLARLRELHLGAAYRTDRPIGVAGVRALAHSMHLRRLRTLDLNGSRMGDAGLAVLADSPLAERLRGLEIGGIGLTPEGARTLARAERLAGLRDLELCSNSLGDAGAVHLAGAGQLTELRKLGLAHTDIGDAGIRALARAPLLAKLRQLDLEGCPFGNVGARELVRSPHLARLRELNLHDVDNPGPTVRKALLARFGKRTEIHLDEDEEERYDLGPDPTPASPHLLSPQESAFLRDIRANPDEDAPRLVYADWLEEHGGEQGAARAEFIRTQCALACLGEDDPRRSELEARTAGLLEAHGQRWTELAFADWLEHPADDCPCPDDHQLCRLLARSARLRCQRERPAKGDPRRAKLKAALADCEERLEAMGYQGHYCRLPIFGQHEFRRGFLERVGMEEALFVMFAEAVPDLGGVRELTILPDDTEAVAGDRVVRRLLDVLDGLRLRTLELSTTGVADFRLIEALAASPHLAGLTSLQLLWIDGEGAGDAAARVLAASPYLANLRTLELYVSSPYTDAAIEAVVRSPHLQRLTRFQLYTDDPELTEAGLALYRARFGSSDPGNP
jgi:uncharacterized protein (TIGR02996 family)